MYTVPRKRDRLYMNIVPNKEIGYTWVYIVPRKRDTLYMYTVPRKEDGKKQSTKYVTFSIPEWKMLLADLITHTDPSLCSSHACKQQQLHPWILSYQLRSQWSLIRHVDAHANLYLSVDADVNFRTPDKSANWIFFLFLNQNICCGYSKEPFQWDGSWEHPKHLFKSMGKGINGILGAQLSLIGPMCNVM